MSWRNQENTHPDDFYRFAALFCEQDINANVDYAYLWDERCAGKDADAQCSVRIRHYLRTFKAHQAAGKPMPDCLVVTLDNCVGQNKSQAVIQFFVFLSLWMYKKVVLLYLLPGHSHFKPDRVVAHIRKTYNGQDLFVPSQFAARANTSPNVNAEVLHNDAPAQPHFRGGWKSALSKHIGELEAGYTKDAYMFEIESNQGKATVTRRRVASSPDAEARTVVVVQNVTAVRRALLLELFGTDDPAQISVDRLKLPAGEPRVLTDKKVKSIMDLFHLIPRQYLGHFPCLPGEDVDVDHRIAARDNAQRAKALAAPGTRGPVATAGPQMRSIMTFFPALREPEPAPAPSPWREAKCKKTGRTYYYHSVTKESRWRKPAE